MISAKALVIIENALIPLLRREKEVGHIDLIVSPESLISKLPVITTRFGQLKVVVSNYVPKGYSYLIERSPCKGNKGFNWITKKGLPASVGERTG